MTTKVILFFWCYKSFYEKLLRIVDSDGSWEMEVFLRYTFNI